MTADRSRLRIIRLRLMRARDMFELPQADLFSEYRSFLTGVEFCLSEMRGAPSFRQVQLEISLPASEISDDIPARLSRTLGRYCEDRMRYNRAEGRAQRYGGVSALRIGLPVCVIGLLLTIAAARIEPSDGVFHTIADTLGWVLVWIGLWFPIDQFLFYPLLYGRENRVLRQLADALIVVVPHADEGGRPAQREGGRAPSAGG